MRASFAVLGLFTLGAVAATPVAADGRVASDKATIERIMALAEADLNLRRADLGLIGAVLPAAPLAKLPASASGVDRVHGVDRVDRLNRVDGVPAVSAPVPSPAVEALPAVQSQR